MNDTMGGSPAQKDQVIAEHLLHQRVNACRANYGREARETALAEVELSQLLIGQHRAREALGMLRHAVEVLSPNASDPDSNVGDSLFALGLALDQNDRDTEAIDFYFLAYSNYFRTLGPLHATTVIAAMNLAEAARVAADYELAERWFRVALAGELEREGAATVNTAQALNNLAETLIDAGRVAEATPLAKQALKLRETHFGNASPMAARSRAVVLLAAVRSGDRDLVAKTIEDFRTISGSDAIRLPVSVGIALLEADGDFNAAVKYCEQVLRQLSMANDAVDELRMPNQRLLLQFTLGALRAKLGDWPQAIQDFSKAFESETSFLSDEAKQRSQRQMRALFGQSRRRIASMLDILAREEAGSDTVSPAHASIAYQIIQQRRGMETRLLTLQKPSFVGDRGLTSASPTLLAETFEQMRNDVGALKDARVRLVDLQLRAANAAAPRSDESDAQAVSDEIEMLERKLARHVGSGSYDWAIMGVTSGKPQLQPDEAIVEYFFSATPEPTYYAFVVTHESVQMKTVGDADVIDRAIRELRTALNDERTPASDVNSTSRRRAVFLFNRLIRPVLPFIDNVSRLYVVPDGDVGGLPFDLLPLDDGRMAIDKWTITHLWNGGERAGFSLTLGSPQKPSTSLVVSDPAFASSATDQPWHFVSLPAAVLEGNAIAEQTGAIHFARDAATKAAVVAAGSPEFMHFATHSFWLPHGESEKGVNVASNAPLFRARSKLADPMQRSGIALALADVELDTPTAAAPGILFAADVLDLDLRSTDLVVLSSCQSGIGDTAPGDGMQGLRRAFRAAGASTVVSSLWKVPDEATSMLMVDFYKRLLNGERRGDALRNAKLALRVQAPDDPVQWAGFVLDGSDKPLFRFSPIRNITVANLSGISLSFERAMSHIAAERWDDALQSLKYVIDSETAEPDLRSEAGYERAGVFRRTGRLVMARDAYDALINDVNTTADVMHRSVVYRALVSGMLGDYLSARNGYSAALAMSALNSAERVKLLVNRGFVLRELNETEAALADWTDVIELPDAAIDQRVMALLNRADLYRQLGRSGEAVMDANAIIHDTEFAGMASRGKAFLVLALCALDEGVLPKAISFVEQHLQERVPRKPHSFARKVARCKSGAELQAIIGTL